MTEDEYRKAVEILKTHRLKPSDALHAAVMITNNISRIATEDAGFKKLKGIVVE